MARLPSKPQRLGLAEPARGLGIAIADYDRDGHIDLFVANDSMVEFLYHNRGDGTFEEVGLVSQVAVDVDGRTYAGMGVDFADYNNDGWPDIVVTNLANQRYALYQNDGDGSFTYASHHRTRPDDGSRTPGGEYGYLDYDNDGWKDLLIAQGHDLDTVELTYPICGIVSRCCWHEIRAGRFVDVSAELEASFVRRGLHAAWRSVTR